MILDGKAEGEREGVWGGKESFLSMSGDTHGGISPSPSKKSVHLGEAVGKGEILHGYRGRPDKGLCNDKY